MLFCSLRAPHFPLECFHGNCYSERVDLEEQDGYFTGLHLSLLADGNVFMLSVYVFACIIYCMFMCWVESTWQLYIPLLNRSYCVGKVLVRIHCICSVDPHLFELGCVQIAEKFG